MDAEMYERALGRTGKIVAGTRLEQFGDATPCDDWDVRTLLNHIIAGCVSFAAGASGERVELSDGTDHIGDDHVGAFERAAKNAAETFRTPGALESTFTMPWGDSPGKAVLGLALADAAVHGWDLAKATGQQAEIEEDIAQEMYAMTSGMMEPNGSYPRGASFKQPVEVADDAPAADKLLAYLGRRP